MEQKPIKKPHWTWAAVMRIVYPFGVKGFWAVACQMCIGAILGSLFGMIFYGWRGDKTDTGYFNLPALLAFVLIPAILFVIFARILRYYHDKKFYGSGSKYHD